jgi:Flp pilus assembly protein TadB
MKRLVDNDMNKNYSNSGGGVSFAGLLTVAFIVLKLCGIINWSWVWVLSPIWISVIIVVIILIVLFVAEKKNRWW